MIDMINWIMENALSIRKKQLEKELEKLKRLQQLAENGIYIVGESCTSLDAYLKGGTNE